jgi:hypothetical protein
MERLFQIILVILTAVSVAIADALIKKRALAVGNFSGLLTDPWMLLSILLHVVQIALFGYLFIRKWELGVVGLMQAVLYSLIVVSAGVLYFKETLTLTRGIGMGAALLGVILMNL